MHSQRNNAVSEYLLCSIYRQAYLPLHIPFKSSKNFQKILIVVENMLLYDVNNGIARRSWARNKEAIFAIEREMERTPSLKVTVPKLVDENVLNNLYCGTR